MKLIFAFIGITFIVVVSFMHIENIAKENEQLKKDINTAQEQGEAIGRYALYLQLKETKQICDNHIFIDIKRWNCICDSLEN